MVRKVWIYREQIYPYVAGVIAAAAVALHVSEVFSWVNVVGVDLGALFGAVFDVAAILTAFLFSFFGFAMSPGGGFIQKMFGTKVFRLFLRYVAEALILGGLLTVVSIVLMVMEDHGLTSMLKILIYTVWVFLTVTTIFAFFRVAYVFLIWVRAGSLRAGRQSAL